MPMMQREEYLEGQVTFEGNPRVVMGYQLPSWQRPSVWTRDQEVSFMESVWKGVPLGTWTFNRTTYCCPLDDLLIDGQQRLTALENYLKDAFPVLGYKWSEVTVVDTRFFDSLTFGSYITETKDEDYLRGYYNMMNFGGTAHTEDQRA
jgi:hypothetical protein